jgi:hypothetical protein
MMQQDYNTSMHRTTAILLIGSFFLACRAEAGIVNADAELAFKHDDNLSRAESGQDKFGDNAVNLDLKLSWNHLLTPNSGLRLSGGLRLTEQARFDALSHIDLNAGIRYRIQPISGYTAPWIELGGGYQRQNYRDSQIRDGNVWSVDAILGKRFTDCIGGRVGVTEEWRQADNEDVFNWRRHRIFAALDYRLGLDTSLYANLSRDFGSQVFTATATPDFLRAAMAVADDPAFGLRRAYRLDAVATTVELGVNLPLNAANTLDFGARHFSADADGGHSYDETELRLSWLYRF